MKGTDGKNSESLALQHKEKVVLLRTHLANLRHLLHTMANHKATKKAIRSSAKKRLLNRYQHKTTRNMIKRLRETHDAAVAGELYRTVSSMLDRLAKRNVIHKNKASNNKSKLARFVNKLTPAAV